MGKFEKGNPGGPGRPVGSRHRLGESFLSALRQDFEQHGAATIKRARESDPVAYVRMVASLVPQHVRVDVRQAPAEDTSDADLMALIARAKQADEAGDADGAIH